MQARDMNITICTCRRLIQEIQAKRVCDELSFCRWQQSCLAFEVGVLETEFHGQKFMSYAHRGGSGNKLKYLHLVLSLGGSNVNRFLMGPFLKQGFVYYSGGNSLEISFPSSLNGNINYLLF